MIRARFPRTLKNTRISTPLIPPNAQPQKLGVGLCSRRVSQVAHACSQRDTFGVRDQLTAPAAPRDHAAGRFGET